MTLRGYSATVGVVGLLLLLGGATLPTREAGTAPTRTDAEHAVVMSTTASRSTLASVPRSTPASVSGVVTLDARASVTAARRWDAPASSTRTAPAALAAAAPTRGPARVVSVRSVAGRPVVDTRTVDGRAAATGAVAAAQRAPGVVSVSVDTVVRLAEAAGATYPRSNDPQRAGQWALDRLRAEATWSRGTGSGVTVAVVDTGVDATHPDLSGVVLPGVDLVGAGDASTASTASAAASAVSTASSARASTTASTPSTKATATALDGSDDENGHGTHVAGILAAIAGNRLGVAGLAPGVRILPIRVLDGEGAGYDSVIADGIIKAVDRGASVINLSVAADRPGLTADAVRYALSKGVVVVAAAGNARAAGNPTSYPAADDGVIGVAATDAGDHDATFSNTGRYVDLAAPGVRIRSTYRGGGYQVLDGTSMAAPYVSSVAAMIKAIAPDTSPTAVAALLEGTATDLGPTGRDDATGYGLVNPYAAVCAVLGCDAGALAPATLATSVRPAAAGATVAYGTAVRARFTLADAAGAPIAGGTAQVCVRTAPATTATCTTTTADAAGTVTWSATPRADTSVHVTHPGTTATAASTSTTVVYRVVQKLTLRAAGRTTLTATVSPARAQRTTLERWTGRTWTVVRTTTARPTLRFDRLPRATYRLRAAATGPLPPATTTTRL